LQVIFLAGLDNAQKVINLDVGRILTELVLYQSFRFRELCVLDEFLSLH